MKKLLILSLSVLFLFFGFCQKPPATSSSVSGIKELIAKGALVVDVRTPEEYQSGHYPNAKNIPIDEVESRLAEFGDKANNIIVYCRAGNRSTAVKQILEKNGFTKVTNGGGLRDMPQ